MKSKVWRSDFQCEIEERFFCCEILQRGISIIICVDCMEWEWGKICKVNQTQELIEISDFLVWVFAYMRISCLMMEWVWTNMCVNCQTSQKSWAYAEKKKKRWFDIVTTTQRSFVAPSPAVRCFLLWFKIDIAKTQSVDVMNSICHFPLTFMLTRKLIMQNDYDHKAETHAHRHILYTYKVIKIELNEHMMCWGYLDVNALEFFLFHLDNT